MSFSPLTKEQQEQFSQLRNSLNDPQTVWLAGYFAALSENKFTIDSAEVRVPSAQSTTEKIPLTVLFGSRTGNGQGLASQIGQQASALGFDVKLKNMTDYKVRDLQQENNLIVVVSTHGEGEPPFEAKEVYDFIHGKRAPKLEKLKYTVLGLGDSSYLQFCKTGKDFDAQLQQLGGERIIDPAYLDVNFRDHAGTWIESTLKAFGGVQKVGAPISARQSKVSTDHSEYSAKNPFTAEVIEKIELHAKDSDRQTVHLEILAPGLKYETGDAAGILPLNNANVVAEFLRATTLPADAEISIGDTQLKLSDALTSKFELSKLTIDVLQKYNEFHKQEKLTAVLSNPEVLKDFIYGRDIVDLFRDYPVKIKAQDLVNILRPLQARLYSISSSPNAVPGEVHLTVGVVEYNNRGRNKKGACSNYLADLDIEKQKIGLFIEKNPNFRLPSNPSTPIIMVGAGTGIAPFRGFIQERELQEYAGKSWLIFGNRNFESEFLYQTEWHQFIKSGALTRMDVAFSRDSDKKVYVQHRLLENAKEVYQWLESGAHFYICGDMKKMAGDVQAALKTIVAKQGNLNEEDANAYLLQLQKDKRLQLDVY